MRKWPCNRSTIVSSPLKPVLSDLPAPEHTRAQTRRLKQNVDEASIRGTIANGADSEVLSHLGTRRLDARSVHSTIPAPDRRIRLVRALVSCFPLSREVAMAMAGDTGSRGR